MADVLPDREALLARIAELEQINEHLRARLAGSAEEVGRAAERTRLHAANVDALRELLERAQAHVEALQSSTSWRVTWPIRALIEPLRRGAGRRRTVLRAAVPPSVERVRRTGPAAEFPLPGDVAAHPALLAETQPPLSASVSVVIPTWNAGAELHWLLRKLRAQRGLAAVEIILVDSGSSDGTPELGAALGCRVVPIDRATFSHSTARNLGASVATGDLLLFMVQDAYPLGDDWLAGMARALLHPAREADRLVAVSCVEFGRADSEMIYDQMARTHYEFLGCAEGDRIGRLTTPDQEALRRQGQLSDVACLIPRAIFEKFQFRGRYAEDLTLGIRLIEAGHQIAMLSSIRVAHAHHRPARYYVRRVFVDVVFLAGVFADFHIPLGSEPVGAAAAASALSRLVPALTPDPRVPPATMLEEVIKRIREAALPTSLGEPPQSVDFGFAPLGEWLGRLHTARATAGRVLSPAEQRGAAALREMVVGRLTGLHDFVALTWPVADAATVVELEAAIRKTLAMSLGAQLAFCHLGDVARGSADPLLAELKPLLLAGI